MKPLKGREIRKRWIEFFESKGHRYIPGVNLIPQGDKSLLWVNAGVTGLKKYFDGSEIPPCRRIVNVQKSIRTNDIENVGFTARHHTFFEMLGNFSIGDYFRDEVIPWAFEILTSEDKGFGLDPNKLYITYQPDDKATLELWVKCGMARDHMIPMESNFWEIGEGPCGPDTEMFYDRGEEYDPKGLGVKMLREDMENDRYIEIWNIVFSQYNSVAGVERKDYKELPSKNIDTGSGLERIACILQGTKTNFETDLFMPIIEATKALCGKPYEGENLKSYRVIADHARCLTFALSDGAYFSNEGRGYVLRRIIRRAMRYGRKLGVEKPFMHELIGVVAKEYSDFYPELLSKKDLVSKMVLDEEEKFIKTLSSGEEILREAIEGKKVLEGPLAFKLYDTFGFPLDLTVEICQEAGVEVDVEGFKAKMEEQRERARNARGEAQSFAKQSKDLMEFKEPSTFDYERLDLESEVIGTFVDGEKAEEISEEGEVAFRQTPFYAESGGQVSDLGRIESESFSAQVIGVRKAPSGQHLMHVRVEFGSLKVGDKAVQKVDPLKRALTARNHSATHLLHAAIGEVLGTHVDQKGSFVNQDYLRFDFSSLSKISKEDLRKIEDKVNLLIAEGIEEETKVLPIEEAKKLGAEMEFSEKYGDVVRVVCFGDYSREFCGGTHVKNTSEIGVFAIVSEGAVSSGVRRIEARTSLGAYSYLRDRSFVLSSVSEEVGNPADSQLTARVKGLKGEIAAKNKELEAVKAKLASASAKAMDEEFVEVGGVKLLAKIIEGAGRNDLMKIGDSLKVKYPDCLLFLVGKGEGKSSVVAFASGLGASKLGANGALKEAGPYLQGSGGGRPEMSQGSASDLSRFSEAVTAIKAKLA